MTNRWRVEAWSLPLASTTRTVYAVPFISGSYSETISEEGRGQITVRGDWDRLTDVVDDVNNVGSLLRIFQDNTLIGSFFTSRTATEISDDGNKIVTISGPNQASVLQYARVENYDYPVRPAVESDWNFGTGTSFGSFTNGGFETTTETDSTFEDQTLQGWESIPDSGDFNGNDSGPVVNDTDAQAGTYSLEWNPDIRHSGVRKRITLLGGESYNFSVYIKSTTTGKRFTFGIDKPTGATSSTTNSFVYNGILMAELENVPRNPASNGLPGGSTDGTWQQTVLQMTTPTFDTDEELNSKTLNVYVQFDHHDGSDGPIARIDSFTATGAGLGLLPWYRTNAAEVTTFVQDNTHVRSEDWAAKVVTTGASRGIAQVVEELDGGKNYTFSVWVYHEAGSNQDFTASIKRKQGGGITASTTVSVPTATWTQIQVYAKADDADIVVVLVKDTAGTFWVDDATLGDGFPAASWGNILQQLLDDAAIDHTGEAGVYARQTLPFLDYSSFSTTTDSNGANWTPGVVEYRAVRGKRYDAILNDGIDMGYEWRVTDSVASGLALDVYNKYDFLTRTGGMGTNRVGTNRPPIRFGNGVVAGPIVQQGLGANRVHAEGDELRWSLRRNTSKIAAYDTREFYEGDINLLGDETLGQVAQEILNETTLPTIGLKIDLDPTDNPDVPLPYTDFFLGDTYPIDLIGLFSGPKRVVAITTDFSAGLARFTVEFDQRSYTSDPTKAMAKAVSKLLDKFDELRLPTSQLTRGSSDHEHDQESWPTLLIAASNAREEVANMADYRCDGDRDQEEFESARALIQTLGGGRIQLSEGDFYFDWTGITGSIFDNWGGGGGISIQLVGAGVEATTIHVQNSPSLNGTFVWDVTGSGSSFREFRIEDNNASGLDSGVWAVGNNYVTIENIAGYGATAAGAQGAFITTGGTSCIFRGLKIDYAYYCIELSGDTDSLVEGCTLVGKVGVRSISSIGARIVNNAFFANEDYVLITSGTSNPGNIFSGNYIEEPFSAGVFVATSGWLVDGNTVNCKTTTMTSQCLYINTTGHGVISNNVIFARTNSPVIQANGIGIVVSGNTIDAYADVLGGFGIQYSSDYGVVSDNVIYASSSNGVGLYDLSGDYSTITGNVGYGGINDDCASVSGFNVVVANNHFQVSGGAATPVACLFVSAADGALIANNQLIGGDYGLRTDGNGDIDMVIEGNIAYYPYRHGMELAAVSTSKVSGNLIHSPGFTTTNTYDGILLSGDSNDNYIEGNTVIPLASPATRYGINLSAATCDDNIVVANDLRGTFGTSALNDAGTGTILQLANDATYGSNFVDGVTALLGYQSNLSHLSQGGTLTTGTGTFKLPFSLPAEVLSIILSVGTSPTGADLIIDVQKNATTGASMWTAQANQPRVVASDADGISAEFTPQQNNTFASGDYLVVNIDQIGSTVAGANLVVSVEWRPV